MDEKPPMDNGTGIREQLAADWIPQIYAEKIRMQRTRACQLEVPERENKADILHTLLGIELKVGNTRFSCPDLATARYLQVFARLGCRNIAIPYDITKISALADEFEVAWHKMLLIHADAVRDKSPQAKGRGRSGLLKLVRLEIDEIGAGDAVPQFTQTTKQRDRL